MSGLILSLFPGADLLGRAFELHGWSVVRGPDLLFGQDINDWILPPAGRFDGVIGGPPCQTFGTARNIGGSRARHADQIPKFWEVVRQVKPKFAVMENVMGARNHEAIPDDAAVIKLRDWDCGGHTHRKRIFACWPFSLANEILPPAHRDGEPEHSVLASSHKLDRSRNRMQGGIKHDRAGELQGWPEIAQTLWENSDGGRIFPQHFMVHMLGNGVPKAMGTHVAEGVTRWHSLDQKEKPELRLA